MYKNDTFKSCKPSKPQCKIVTIGLTALATLALFAPLGAFAQGSAPTLETIEHNQRVENLLPFSDTRDFEFAERGFLGTRKDPIIRAKDGHTVWDLTVFDFLNGEAPATVNPSLWRHSKLIAKHGLFQVTDRIYQVRGFDAANITFVRSDTGWIVIDTLTTVETAQAAYELVTEKIGKFPIVAIIYTHSHTDHFGGAGGLKAALTPNAKIIAPVGFLKAAISENIIAGPAMIRRAAYQFGIPLDKSVQGTVGSAIGAAIPIGSQELIAPTQEITVDGDEQTIDGVHLKFHLTLGTEAPSEMNIAFPDWKVIDLAENANPTQHNILTPRGAVIRDAKAWADDLSQALDWSEGYDALITSHGWPRFGASEISSYISKHRDMYAYLHDQTVRLMNKGLTGEEIAAQLKLPKSLEQEWYNHPYYGSLSFNARAVYQYYMGWYDANPVHLAPLPQETRAQRYVEAMGGAAHVRDLAQKAYDAADYAWASELLNNAVYADHKDKAARELLAKSYEQLAYQSENAVWRNSYLTAASELRNGVSKSNTPSGGLLSSLPTSSLFDILAVRLNPDLVGSDSVKLGFVFPDRNESVTVTIANGVLTHRSGLASNLDATLTIKRSDLLEAFFAGKSIAPKVLSGEAQIKGDTNALRKLTGWFDKPDPDFAIVTSN